MAVTSLREQRSATQGQSVPSLAQQRGGGGLGSVAQQRLGVTAPAQVQAPPQQNTGYLPRWAYNTLNFLADVTPAKDWARLGIQAAEYVTGKDLVKDVGKPTGGQVLGTSVNTALFFLPFLGVFSKATAGISRLPRFAKYAARAGEGAGFGAGFVASKELAEEKPIRTQDIVVGALFGGGVGVIGQAAAGILSRVAARGAARVATDIRPKETFRVTSEPATPTNVKAGDTLFNKDLERFQVQALEPTEVRVATDFNPLLTEARKYKSAEEFHKAFTQEIKHGRYYHITDDPNFKIDLKRGPRDMSSLASGKQAPGSLMTTSDLQYWAENYPGRKYVAVIDQSKLAPSEYTQVNRGMGNEFFLKDSSKVRVEKVIPIEQALKEDAAYRATLPQTKSQLTSIWEEANKGTQQAVKRFAPKINYRVKTFDGDELVLSPQDLPQLRRVVVTPVQQAAETVLPVGRVASELEAASRTAPRAAGRVTQELNAEIPGTATRSRAKQFPESFDEVRQLEGAEGFSEGLAARGVEPRNMAQIVADAKPVPRERLASIKFGEPVDDLTSFVAGANKTFVKEIENLPVLAESGRVDESIKVLQGYIAKTSEPAVATRIQAEFSASTRMAEGVIRILEASKGVPDIQKKLFVTRQIQELRVALNQSEGSPLFGQLKKFHDAITEWAVAAKLTSPVTHIINTASNILTFVQRGIERVVSAGIAASRGRTSFAQELSIQAGYVNGFRSAGMKLSQSFRDIFAEVFSKGKGLREIINEANKLPRSQRLAFVNKEISLSERAKIEQRFNRQSKLDIKPGAIPGRFGTVVRLPFRFLQIADDFVKTILNESELHRLAVREAYAQGHRGQRLSQEVARMFQSNSFTDAMQKRASDAAKEFTFQTEPGEALQAIQTALNKIPGGRIVVPFVQTPTNIIKFYGQRSALGILAPRNLNALFKKELAGIDRDDAIARLTVGLFASLSVFAALYKNKNITGDVPQSPAARDKFYREGKRPYSIKIGNYWVPYNRLQPVGLYISQMAAFRDAVDRAKDKGEVEGAGLLLAGAAVSFAKSLTEIPFVSGISDAIDAINDPERSGPKFIQRAAAGFIPLWLRNVRLATDPTVRSPRSLSAALQERLPGLSQQVPARLDAFGREAQYPGSTAERLLIPSLRSPSTSNPLEDELTSIDYTPGTAQAEIQGKELTPEQKRELGALLGQATLRAAQRIVQNPYYQAIKDKDAKIKMLKKAIEIERRQVRRQYELRLR